MKLKVFKVVMLLMPMYGCSLTEMRNNLKQAVLNWIILTWMY